VLFFLFVALVFFSSALVFLVLAWVVAVEWLREREHLALEQNLHEAGGLGGQGGRQTVDRGPGLPADTVERVFDKFYRAPGAAPGGTGLGLSIAKGFVEAHGGTIAAENRAEGGAVFTIRLPLGEQPSIVEDAE